MDRPLTSTPATPSGYHGCYLRIDLAHASAQRVPLAEDVLRRYLGGSGLGVYLLLRERAPGVDPLAPRRRWRLSSARWSAAP